VPGKNLSKYFSVPKLLVILNRFQAFKGAARAHKEPSLLNSQVLFVDEYSNKL